MVRRVCSLLATIRHSVSCAASSAAAEIALNTTFVKVVSRVGSGQGCSNHNTVTENTPVVVYLEQEPEVRARRAAALVHCSLGQSSPFPLQGSLPDPAGCAKYTWVAASQQVCVNTKACDFENNPPSTEVCYTQVDNPKMNIEVYEESTQKTNRCFEISEHEVHAEWITVESPSGGNTNPSPQKKKLGAGPIVGIVLAALITLGVAAYAAFWFITKRHLNPFGSSAYTPFAGGASSARSSSMVASAGYQQAPMNNA